MSKTNQHQSFQLIAALALASHAPSLRKTSPSTVNACKSEPNLKAKHSTDSDMESIISNPIFDEALASIKCAGMTPDSALNSEQVQLAIKQACEVMSQPEFQARARSQNKMWHTTRRPISLPLSKNILP